MINSREILDSIDRAVKKEFEANRRLLSFDEYLGLVGENPRQHLRGSAEYMVDTMDHFGKTPIAPIDGAAATSAAGTTNATFRYNVFDIPVDGAGVRVVGQEAVQAQIYRVLKSFTRQRLNNKLILLHGPNGSAKSSIIHALMGGMERYSHESAGALYSINWVFPVERYTKGGMGLNTSTAAREALTTFAKLPDEEVAARIPCDLRDHPLLIIPTEGRRDFMEKLVGKKQIDEVWETLPSYLTKGDLCHRCRLICDALLVANNGDYKKVLMHLQVERFFLARRYRKGLVTIEPQMHVDAQYHQLTYNKSVGSLPASLQSINLFTLTGDLVDGNRGLVEYSDLLKRPVDTFKYLLTACETGSVNVGTSIAYLDSVLMGSTNEVQLDAFKEFPDFTSFKARIELIRVPYLLSVGAEQEIYDAPARQFAGDKHVAPHTAWTVALWSVLTRLKKPNPINFPPNVSALVSNLTPLEKARLYDTGEMPVNVSPDDRKALRASLRRIRDEYSNIPYYEGRMGASAREMKSILFDASQNAEFPCLSPLAVLREMEEFVKRVSEYEFLKQEIKDGYHDAAEFINVTRNEYLNHVDHEVRDSIGIYESGQWEDFLKRYVQHISLALKREKTKNPITGKLEDPDFALIDEFERIVEAPAETVAKESFRQGIISQIGAWSLDHPREPVVYARVFPDFWRKLERHFFESQKAVLTKMHDALLVYGQGTGGGTSGKDVATSGDLEGSQLAQRTLNNMQSRLGYCELCAKEVILFLMRQRY